MANDNRPTAPATTNVTVTDLKDLIEAIQATAPTKKVSWAKRDPNTPFAKGKKRRERAKLKYKFLQNGYSPNPKNLFDEEIELINQLVPGRYVNNIVTVRVVEKNGTEPDEMHIYYQNKTFDQRMAVASAFGGRGLIGLLKLCVAEAAAAQAKAA